MDHEDQYVYSQCELHHAYKIQPCFDQTDLKGTFKLCAYAPKEWKVISNERYLENPKIPQFVYNRARPYVEIKTPEELLHNQIPQSLYCRKSKLKFVMNDAYSIFKVTSDSMKFFDELFQQKYPFGKYDQIFCPEYSTGGMENEEQLQLMIYRANTIIHELSHMWFGHLVTMEWWDDLWLNESFAEFISHLCQDNVRQRESKLLLLLLGIIYGKKALGLTDEKSTTPPIYCQIDNTDQAKNIFDGITYAKGAALIKQIYFTMGREGFSKAMGLYFQKHDYGNTKLNDFFEINEYKQKCYCQSNYKISF